MDIFTHKTDSLCCLPETKTTLQVNYTPIKLNYKKMLTGRNTNSLQSFEIKLSNQKLSTSYFIFHGKMGLWPIN